MNYTVKITATVSERQPMLSIRRGDNLIPIFLEDLPFPVKTGDVALTANFLGTNNFSIGKA
jgi:hypothetical protein